MAGIIKSSQGSHRTETEHLISVNLTVSESVESLLSTLSPLTTESMQEVLHEENQSLLDTQNEMLEELKCIKLWMQIGTEEILTVE